MAKITTQLPGGNSTGISYTSQLINNGEDNTSAYIEFDEIGEGLILGIDNKITLDLDYKTLVPPILTVTWAFLTNDYQGYPFEDSTENNAITEKGVICNAFPIYSYATPAANEIAPYAVSGSFGTTIPPPNTGVEIAEEITTDTTYTINFFKQNTGLLTTPKQVVFPTGDEVVSDSVSIKFTNKYYFGYSTNTTLLGIEVTGLIDNNFQFDNKLEINATAEENEYTYYCYDDSYPELSSIIMDNGSQVLGAFTLIDTVSIVNGAGLTVPMKVYRSNDTLAFTNNNLKFS